MRCRMFSRSSYPSRLANVIPPSWRLEYVDFDHVANMSLRKGRLKSKNSEYTTLYRGAGRTLWKGYDPHPGLRSHFVRFIHPLVRTLVQVQTLILNIHINYYSPCRAGGFVLI